MKSNYWFPEVFVFPDTEDPVASKMDDITVLQGKEAEVDLSTIAPMPTTSRLQL